jgi:hypothetical protein
MGRGGGGGGGGAVPPEVVVGGGGLYALQHIHLVGDFRTRRVKSQCGRSKVVGWLEQTSGRSIPGACTGVRGVFLLTVH